MALFDRRYRVQIETVEIEDLDVSFQVTKTKKKEPNTCQLTVLNLNEDHRLALGRLEKPYVEISAGYEDDVGLIFKGRLRDIHSYKEGSNWITEVDSGDGEEALQTARVNESFSPGTPLNVVIKKLAEKMKVGIGNAAIKALQGNFDGASNEFVNGTVLSGRASTEMDGLLKSAGLEWSVQDDELQLIKIGEALEGLAVVLNPSTGLIGSPTIGSDGVVNCRTLMNWTIIPGRRLQIESRQVPKAFYKAEVCTYLGDTAGNDWYVDIEARAL